MAHGAVNVEEKTLAGFVSSVEKQDHIKNEAVL